MRTECNAELFGFARVQGRSVVAAFDGGKITLDAGALLLGASDRATGMIVRLDDCFTDSRSPEQSSTRWQRWLASASWYRIGLRRCARPR
jgi:hypothetical protein